MSKATLLFADNNPDFRRTRVEFLEQDGYRVLQAGNPDEARDLLRKGGIDLAILDLRLERDEDKNDESGLILARDVAPAVPKIIVTKFDTTATTVIQARKPQLSGLPAAVDFVDMVAGPEALIASIRLNLALHVERRVGQVISGLSSELEKYFEETRRQAAFTHRIGMLLIVVGGLFFIASAAGALWGQSLAAVASAVSGVLAEGLAALFKKLSDDANKRMDKWHKELLELLSKVPTIKAS